MTTTYTRIRKPAARKLFAEGKSFWIVPCNLRPEFGLLINGDTLHSTSWEDFEKFLNCFIYYNCNNECGRYPAFYTDNWGE